MVFGSQSGLWFHNQKDHLKLRHPCHICGKTYTQVYGLVSNHSLVILFTSKKMRSKSWLIMAWSTLQKYVLEMHIKQKHGLGHLDFKCEICGEAFQKESGLKLHQTVMHTENGQKIRLNKRKPAPGKLSFAAMKNFKTFPCNQCDKVSSASS